MERGYHSMAARKAIYLTDFKQKEQDFFFAFFVD